ncbi:hypothetical protein H1V43_37990 [Streptomyces sp. PSKA54]|uniref:Secreted protein n=1 Tax=Streptomyces himalayensis subsp. aureolus TaxID=2758039 RepID=A0A7W2D935_9ACTN|nr:hypothetical protein [Streptomyces himalayensis]MBA4866988.1 hypothetical protein [Streptomyces himalayensis subsp. aureolus]
MTRVVLACVIGTGVVATAGGAAQAAPATEGGSKPVKTIEKGYALSCTGQSRGVTVAVDLYQNSAFGSHTSLSVETPEGEYGGGYGPEETTLFSNGTIAADIPVRKLDDTAEPAGNAVISGTYEAVGRPQPVHEVIEDPADHYVISKGTNIQLRTVATVDVLGERVPLSCSTSFAFDLTVWRLAPGQH